MQAFIRKTGRAAPLEGKNIDTDQIVPARFLKTDRKQGYGHILFHDLRFDAQEQEIAGFVLNQPKFRNAQILLADTNFGCGSSREAAVYALYDYGIRTIIAPSFGDIFYNNCLKNGIVPVRLDEQLIASQRLKLSQAEHVIMTVDLEKLEVIFPDGSKSHFELDPFWRECLLKGVDDLELTLGYQKEIQEFEQRYLRERPWLQMLA